MARREIKTPRRTPHGQRIRRKHRADARAAAYAALTPEQRLEQQVRNRAAYDEARA